MKNLLAAIVFIEFVVILWLALSGNQVPPAPLVPAGSSPGAAVDRVSPPLDTKAPPARAEVADEPESSEGTLVYGSLRADDGEPVTKGWVTFVDAGARAKSIRPDEKGLWARTGVAAGNYVLKVQSEGFEPLEQEFVVGAAGPQRLDLVLNRAVLVSIHFVTPDGKPLLPALGSASKEAAVSSFGISGGLTAIATREPPPARLPPTLLRTYTRYGTGEFKARSFGFEPGEGGGGNGNLTIRGGLPVYVSACLRSEVITTVRIEAPTDRLDLVINPAALFDLLSGVTFLLELEGVSELPEQISADLSDRQSMGMNKADVVDGRVTIRDSVPGAMQLSIWPGRGHERYFTNIDLPPGEIVDLGTIRFSLTLDQQILIIDSDGEPVPQASLRIMDRDRSWWEQSGSPFRINTGPDGKTTLKFGPHRFWVRASTKDGRSGVADLDLTAGTQDDFTIRIGEQGEARIEFTETIRVGTRVRAEDAAGRPIWGLTLRMPWTYTTKLPPGEYSLVVSEPGRGEKRTPFHVEIGNPTKLTIR